MTEMNKHKPTHKSTKQFRFLILVIKNQLEQEFSNSVCQRVQVNPMGLEKMNSKLNTTKQKD